MELYKMEIVLDEFGHWNVVNWDFIQSNPSKLKPLADWQAANKWARNILVTGIDEASKL